MPSAAGHPLLRIDSPRQSSLFQVMPLPLLSPPCEEAAARAAPDTPGCAAHANRWVLTATVLASSVVFLEATVINIALPAIQAALGASMATLQWIASTYTLALAALTL